MYLCVCVCVCVCVCMYHIDTYRCGLREQQVFWLTYKYGAYAHLPAIFLLPFLLVMSLRSSRGVENGCTSLQSADFDNIFWSKLVSGWIFGEDMQAPQSWL